MIGNTYETNHLVMKTVEANKHTFEYTTEYATVLGHIFSKTYSLEKGINQFGDKRLYDALLEIKQLHDRPCFIPIYVNKITSKECIQAM